APRRGRRARRPPCRRAERCRGRAACLVLLLFAEVYRAAPLPAQAAPANVDCATADCRDRLQQQLLQFRIDETLSFPLRNAPSPGPRAGLPAAARGTLPCLTARSSSSIWRRPAPARTSIASPKSGWSRSTAAAL